jgi:hypothetical protein
LDDSSFEPIKELEKFKMAYAQWTNEMHQEGLDNQAVCKNRIVLIVNMVDE